MQFDFGSDAIYIKDDERWRELLHNIATEIFDEAGKDTECDEFDDFKYDVLEEVLIDVISDALNDAAYDDRLKPGNFEDFFDSISES